MKKILVIGSINQDITLQMEKLPLPGETVMANSIQTSIGGKGANQAVAASRMGAHVSFIGAVGTGESSDKIVKSLKEDGINCEGILNTEENTGTAYISLDKDAENNIIVYPGANYAITKELLYNNIHLFEESDYCLLQLEIPMDIIVEAIKICNENNVEVVLNPAPYHDEINEDILNNISYYIPNEVEFLSTIGINSKENHDLEWFEKEGLKFADKYQLNLVITLGSRGSMLIQDSKVEYINAQKVNAVDTTAAGDSFIGGFLAALSQGNEIVDSLNFGSKVAGLTVSRYGAISAIPYIDEIK